MCWEDSLVKKHYEFEMVDGNIVNKGKSKYESIYLNQFFETSEVSAKIVLKYQKNFFLHECELKRVDCGTLSNFGIMWDGRKEEIKDVGKEFGEVRYVYIWKWQLRMAGTLQ